MSDDQAAASRAFWDDIIYKDGKLDEEQVLKELADFYFVMKQYPIVLDHITGGRMSKCNYFAGEIIALADDHYQETHDSYLLEEVKDAYRALERGDTETAKEILHPHVPQDRQ